MQQSSASSTLSPEEEEKQEKEKEEEKEEKEEKIPSEIWAGCMTKAVGTLTDWGDVGV